MSTPSMAELSATILMKPPTYNIPTSFMELFDFIFRFNGNQQPIVHDYPWMLPFIAIPLYWVMVFIGPKLMEGRKPLTLKVPLMLWNFALCVVSVFMFFGIALPVGLFTINHGWYQLMCMPSGELYYGPAFFCVWLFALSKYAELIDTLFIILRKRPLHFLHWYHHTTVLAYTWFSLVALTAPGAVFGAVNAFVHSIMYFYFFLTSTGRRPSWGKLVTIIQLTQMVIGISISVCWTIYYFTEENCPMLHPNAYMLSSLALYGSYFALFLNFYIQRYGKKSSGGNKSATTTTPKKNNNNKKRKAN